LIGDYLTDINNWMFIGGALTVGVVLGGLNLLALIPFVLANILLSMFVLPTSYIMDSALPHEVKLILTAMFMVTTYLVYISFVRSG
jgi:hypothetical protein